MPIVLPANNELMKMKTIECVFAHTGVVYIKPTVNPTSATGMTVCHGFSRGNWSRIAVTMHEHIAILLPMPSTNNMKKNRMENICKSNWLKHFFKITGCEVPGRALWCKPVARSQIVQLRPDTRWTPIPVHPWLPNRCHRCPSHVLNDPICRKSCSQLEAMWMCRVLWQLLHLDKRCGWICWTTHTWWYFRSLQVVNIYEKCRTYSIWLFLGGFSPTYRLPRRKNTEGE